MSGLSPPVDSLITEEWASEEVMMTPFVFILLTGFSFSQTDCDTLTFDSAGSQIVGYFYAANAPGSPTLVFTQGFMETGDIWAIGKTLSHQGINVLMFDFRGCFRSEGKQGLIHSQEDIGAAISFLSSKQMTDEYHIDATKIVLGGHSYGGHMSMVYAIHHPEIRRVITISGGDLGILAELLQTNPDLRKTYADLFQSIKRPKGPILFEYEDPIEELMEKQSFFSIFAQTEKLSHTDILMTGGLDDQVVSIEDYLLPLYRRIRANKGQKIVFKIYQTNHSYRNVSSELLEDVITWINRN
jgi:uncharacterized protein